MNISKFLLGLLLIGMVYFTAKVKKFPRSESASVKEIWAAFKDAFSGLLLVVIVYLLQVKMIDTIGLNMVFRQPQTQI
mgnify:CR=1 FL=1